MPPEDEDDQPVYEVTGKPVEDDPDPEPHRIEIRQSEVHYYEAEVIRDDDGEIVRIDHGHHVDGGMDAHIEGYWCRDCQADITRHEDVKRHIRETAGDLHVNPDSPIYDAIHGDDNG